MGPVLKLDDIGIYYEPAEINPPSDFFVIDPPFYIINPAIKRNRKSTKTTKEYTVSKKHSKSLNKDYNYIDDGYTINTRKQKRKEDTTEKSLNLKTNEFSSYLDIDLKKITDVLRDVSMDDNAVPPLTEDAVHACLDLHNLFHARRTKDSSKLKDIRNAEKYTKFFNLTEAELKNEIENTCSQLTIIVEKSRNEIIKKIPRKNQKTSAVKQSVHSNLKHKDMTKPQHKVTKNIVETENTSIVSSTVANIFAEETLTTFEKKYNKTSKDVFFREKNPRMGYDKEIAAADPINKSVNKFKNHHGRDTQKVLSTKDITDYDFEDNTEITPSFMRETEENEPSNVETTISHLNDNSQSIWIETTNNYNQTDDLLEPTTEPMRINIKTHTTNITESAGKDSSNDNAKFNSHNTMTPPVYYSEPSHETEQRNRTVKLTEASTTFDNATRVDNFTNTYFSTPSNDENELNITKKSLTDLNQDNGDNDVKNQTMYKNNVDLFESIDTDVSHSALNVSQDNDFDTALASSVKERVSLMKTDINLPKITTTELNNNTVLSELDNNQYLANQHVTLNSTLQVDNDVPIGTNSIFAKDQEDKTVQTRILNHDITGKLYFSVNKENIPAHFIQNPDGDIRVGIDGISLCDTLNRANETSKLLSVLCKCVRSEKGSR